MRPSLPTKLFRPLAVALIRSRTGGAGETLVSMDIAITPLDPADDAAAHQAREIMAAALAADIPDFPPMTEKRFFGMLRHPWPGNEWRHAVAYLDGAPAGYLEIGMPQLDNLENAEIELAVHPEYRRRGVGRALFEYATGVVRGLGRKRIAGMALEALPGGVARDPAGGAFAEAMGAKPALQEVRRRLDLTTLDHGALDAMLETARVKSAGYSLVLWRDEVPEDIIDDVAYLDGRLLSDSPMGELEWEAEKIDADRIRASEAVRTARERRRYNAGARHDESGRLVAFTTIDCGDVEWHGFQQITLVEPNHRGRRLGALVKVENLRFAMTHEPALRAIDTWNAGVNDHMISINEAMGFRPVDGWQNWQISV